MTTTGEKLIALRARSGLTLDEVAKKAGYQGRSGVQRYFSAEFDRRLDGEVALRLDKALSGTGSPPIGTLEVMGLAAFTGLHEAKPSDEPAPRYHDLPRDVPVYGTALGTFHDGEHEQIEQTTLYGADPIDFFLRPPGVARKQGVYGVYITGSSQSPRFEEGEIAFADPNRPPMIGDDVIVYLRDESYEEEKLSAVLVKRLLRRSTSFVELRQFNPDCTFRVDAVRVSAIHRVLTNAEMLASR